MSRPVVGERVVVYVTSATSVYAEVIAVTYWDKIDVRFRDGEVRRDVRRVIVVDGKIQQPIAGRFMRIKDGY